jgi:hypothetical protein
MARPRPSVPLTTQLLVLLVVATLIPLALMLDRIRTDALDAEQRAATRAGWVARRDAQAVGNAYQVAIGSADALTYSDEFWNGSDADRDRALSTLSLAYAALDGLIDLGVDFQPHGSSSQAPVDADWRAAAVEAAQAGRPTFAKQTGVAPVAGDTALPIVIPIQEVAAPYRQAFLGMTLHIDPLPPVTGGSTPTSDSAAVLVDGRTGRNLGLTSLSSAPGPSSPVPDAASLLSRPRVFHTVDAAGNDQMAAWEAVPGTPWIVLVYVPAESLLSPIRAQAVQQALLALGVSSILSVLLFLFWRRLRRRLHGLELAAGNWASGNWSYRAAMLLNAVAT